MTDQIKVKRGFATLTPEQRKVIASLGGKAAHRNGTAHEFNSEEAKKAGSKGGLANAAKNKSGFRQPEQTHKLNGS